MTHRSFVAYTALHHMLVRLALHRYGALTDPAKDDRSTAAIWTALWGVWRRGLTWYQSTGKWCQTLGWERGQNQLDLKSPKNKLRSPQA